MSPPDLLKWWNLIYFVPLLIAAVYLFVILATGAVTSGEVEAEVEADGDVDVEAEAEATDGEFLFGDPLAFLGARQVSLSLVIEVFFLIWGAIGLIVNELLSRMIANPWLFILPSLVITLVATAVLTRAIATGLAKVMPKVESNAVPPGGLRGEAGEVVHAVSTSRGSVMVSSGKIGFIEVACRVEEGEEPIPRGRGVVLVDYVDDGDYYLV